MTKYLFFLLALLGSPYVSALQDNDLRAHLECNVLAGINPHWTSITDGVSSPYSFKPPWETQIFTLALPEPFQIYKVSIIHGNGGANGEPGWQFLQAFFSHATESGYYQIEPSTVREVNFNGYGFEAGSSLRIFADLKATNGTTLHYICAISVHN